MSDPISGRAPSPVSLEGLHGTARYLVGIDLGTTNCAVAFVDTTHAEPRVRDFPVAQIVAPGELEARSVLPSFCYEPVAGEFPPGSLVAPGSAEEAWVVGAFARKHGGQTPGRLIASAKSWLCHPGVDRTAPLLPWHGASDVTRISPVDASARYLAHLRAAWDAAFPSHPLSEQEVVITVPASFDEVARRLTMRAAEKAGLGHPTLMEEPQAAFYAWMASSGDRMDSLIRAGELTLICDIGGGTSDFTLIEARASGEQRVRFHRVAVGNHLLLGGDNMDLALAHDCEARLTNGRLDPRRWGMLVQACRHAKETLLGPDSPEALTLSIASGTRLVGGALQCQLQRDEVRDRILTGFFPRVALNERPASARSGFQEFGLPYVADPAVTRHLAAFLADHLANSAVEGACSVFPDHILFNGGVFESPMLRKELLEVLNTWRAEATGDRERDLTVLENQSLDLAVARGAAFSAWLRRQPGRRIAAGLARAYYIQVGHRREDAPMAVCLAPAGLEEGQEAVLPQRFRLRLRQPVEFALLSSTTRTHDKVGDLVPVETEQLSPLPPIRTVVSSRRSPKDMTEVEVELRSRLTEIGTLDVRCLEQDRSHSWKLEFDVRGQKRSEGRAAAGFQGKASEALEEGALDACRARIREVFQPSSASGSTDPSLLVRELESALVMGRDQWPLGLLRGLWETLMEVEPGRRRGIMHEARWLNLVGFALRPGYGYTVDDWRVAQTWRLFMGGTAFPKNEMCRAEWCILWRRIAGGLGVGHHRAIAEPYADVFRPKSRKVHRGTHETAEIWRVLGSLELLNIPTKIEIGAHLCDLLERKLETPILKAAWWALGRLGARVPMYGPLNALVPAETVESWLGRIIHRPAADPEVVFAVVQLSRLTGDRYRDIGESARQASLEWLRTEGASAEQLEWVRHGGSWDAVQEEHAFGETLPPGLHLSDDS